MFLTAATVPSIISGAKFRGSDAMFKAKSLIAAALAAIASGGSAIAQELETIGIPSQDGLGFQPAVTELMRDIVWYDDILHIVSAIIVLFVTALLLIVIFKFGEKKNPTPARFTHNAVLEVVWTGVPVLILIVFAIISVPLLYKQLEVPKSDVVIQATGNQWYWSYEYPDEEIEFDALMLAKEELAENGYADNEWLLATDQAVVVPVNSVVHMLVTGADVIHAWTIPAFGVKMDAIPGRMNEIWFNAEQEGLYFGQCSELCGKDHTYMPITVKVVSEAAYEEWVEETKLAQNGGSATEVAAVTE